MNKPTFFAVSIIALLSHAGDFEIKPDSVHMPSRVVGASVSFDDGSFYVTQGSQKAKIEPYNLDTTLRSISLDNLKTFLTHGYLVLNQIDQEFTLKSNLRLLGGGKWWKKPVDAAKTTARILVDTAVGPAKIAEGLIRGDGKLTEDGFKQTVSGHIGGGAIALGFKAGGPAGAAAGAEVADEIDSHLDVKRKTLKVRVGGKTVGSISY